MNYLPLPVDAARQVIDAQTILAELMRVKALARQHVRFLADIKRWLAERPNRGPAKRRHDALKAQTVQGLLGEGLLLAAV